jgi:Flp pilus assembly protein CpaB
VVSTARPVTSPPPAPIRTRRRRRRSGTSRVAPPLWAALIAGIIAVIANVFALGGDRGVQVVVAARDLAPGELVASGDFRFVDASLPDSALAKMLRPSDMNDLAGQVTTHALSVGQPVGHSDLTASTASGLQRTMSIPIDPTHAVGGRLQQGDKVDVIDASTGAAVYVVTNAPVVDIGVETVGSRGLGSGSTKYALTIAVDDQAALRLSAAIAANQLDVVRSTGAAPATPAPTTPALGSVSRP